MPSLPPSCKSISYRFHLLKYQCSLGSTEARLWFIGTQQELGVSPVLSAEDRIRPLDISVTERALELGIKPLCWLNILCGK